jgi:hypothetical protein
MSQEELYHSYVGKLYEMALEPQGWGAFLDDFCTLVDAASAHYVAWAERSDATVFSASSRAIPTGSEQAYIEHYGTIDPRRKFITGRADGKWVPCHEQFDERCVSQSQFYQDFLIPVGGLYGAMTNLGVVDGMMLGLGLHRGQDRKPFGPRETVLLEEIKPHPQRAARPYGGGATAPAGKPRRARARCTAISRDVRGRARASAVRGCGSAALAPRERASGDPFGPPHRLTCRTAGAHFGKTLDKTAETAHVSLNTAKTQPRIAFERTGTHRQADLVKLVLSNATVADA